jgi:SH3-like domain-containing protein
MVPGLVSPQLGLLDGSGATIASLLRQRYLLLASNASPVSFDEVAARAGKQPIAIGGARWYVSPDGDVTGHWVAVRGFDGTQLLLANPGGTGPHFGQQALTRDDFAQRAPFAAVWIDASGLGPNSRFSFVVANTDGQGANVRCQPSTDASIVGALPEGALVTSNDHAWRAVTDASGAQGWVATEYLISPDGSFHIANTGGTGANLRAQPSTDAQIVKPLPEGTVLSGDAHAWRKVTAASGTTSGWVAQDLLRSPGGE